MRIYDSNHPLHTARDAEAQLPANADPEVIDPRTLVPLDIVTIVESVRRTGRLLVCHEAAENCGWGAEIAARVMQEAFDFLDAPVARVCGKNVPMPYAASLEDHVIPKEADLIHAVKSLLEGHDLSLAV